MPDSSMNICMHLVDPAISPIKENTRVGLESMGWGRLFIDEGTSVLKKKNCAGCDGCKKLASITNIEGTFAKGQQFL